MSGHGGARFGDSVPGWMEAWRDRAGPLLSAALAFAREHGPSPYPEGREGIRQLARLVEAAAFDDSLSDEDDERFVEGAGAMLGMLLLAHVGMGGHRERAGTHRIALGERGFFDPFGAIDAALDAERPSVELARRVAEAEAEAGGDGPIARTQHALDDALTRAGYPARVRTRFGPLVELSDGVELDLSRIAELASRGERDLGPKVERFVAMLVARDAATVVEPFASARTRILPRLVTPGFFEGLGAAGGGDGLARRPFVPGLEVALVLAYEGRMRFVRETERRAWEALGDDAFAVAARSLEERSTSTRLRPIVLGSAEGFSIGRADGLAATLALSGAFLGALVRRLGGSMVVALPHRDEMLVFPGDAPPDELTAAVTERHRRAPHALTEALFRADVDGALHPLAAR